MRWRDTAARLPLRPRTLAWLALAGVLAAAAFVLARGFDRYPAFTSPLDPTRVLDMMADEGPAWHPIDGLYFSGWKRINLSEREGGVVVHRDGVRSNGLAFDRSGRLLACLPWDRRVVREEHDGSVTVLADRYEGRRFNSPNDLALDSRGRIYFSDPRYGDPASMEILDDAGARVEGVYRIDPDGSIAQVIAHEVVRPNGVAVSPDDAYLYVAGSDNREGGERMLLRFDLRADGSVDRASRFVVHDWGIERGPDGLAVDREGLVYAAAGRNESDSPIETADRYRSGIYVFTADGDLVSFLGVSGEAVTNCTFGGDDLRTLYITAGGALWSARTRNPGLAYTPASTPPRPDAWRAAAGAR